MKDIESKCPGQLASEDLQYVMEDLQALQLVGIPGQGGVMSCARF